MEADNDMVSKKEFQLFAKEMRDFVRQYHIDMRGDTNSDNGGRRGAIENIRELRSDNERLKIDVDEMKLILEHVKLNTQFRENATKVMWIVMGVVITAVTASSIYGFVNNYQP
eukprot:GHVU01019815.1.p1 GENE.GHVU01019815.1~~GHVU01019815.1.p1  ORF type:complete len:113 (-),score=15.64 GHVU01019815.1:198-536(-)